MTPHIKYLWYVLCHKWFVLMAGVRLRVNLLQLITHDWSKFLPSEWGPYAAYFYGEKNPETKNGFDRAWNHHQNRHPHHWQYWLLTTDNPGTDWRITSRDGGMSYFGLANQDGEFCEMSRRHDEGNEDAESLARALNRAPVPLEMPECYVREMVADWCGAGRAITGKWEVAEWYTKTRAHIILHPATRVRVEELIATIGA
jgi:hypothetical protein